MAPVIHNFAAALLAAPITAGATSATLDNAASFPSLDAGEYCYVVLQNPLDFSQYEIVKVTDITGAVLTIERGQEGTTAQDFVTGSLCELRLTAATLDERYLRVGVASAADVGALPIEGGSLLGELTVNSRLQLITDRSISITNGTTKTFNGIEVIHGGQNLLLRMRGDDTTDRIAFHTDYGSTGNWTERLTILAHNGKVGINNTVPAYDLDVNGSFNAEGNVHERGNRLYGPNNKPTPANLGAVGTSDVSTITGQKRFKGDVIVGNPDDGKLLFKTGIPGEGLKPRFYMAPTNDDGVTWNWGSEFGFNWNTGAWYSDTNLQILAATPTDASHAVRKDYLDQELLNYVPLLGDSTIDGDLTVNDFIWVNKLRSRSGDLLLLTAGESMTHASGNVSGEIVHLAGEDGLRVYSSPDNWATGWAGRHEATVLDKSGNSTFPGTVAANALTEGGTALASKYAQLAAENTFALVQRMDGGLTLGNAAGTSRPYLYRSENNAVFRVGNGAELPYGYYTFRHGGPSQVVDVINKGYADSNYIAKNNGVFDGYLTAADATASIDWANYGYVSGDGITDFSLYHNKNLNGGMFVIGAQHESGIWVNYIDVAYRKVRFGEDTEARKDLNVVGTLTEAGVRVYGPNNKPSAEDIGAAAAAHTHPYLPVSQNAGGEYQADKLLLNKPNSANADWDSIWQSGFFEGNGAANAPEASGWFWGLNMGHSSNSDTYKYGAQIAIKNQDASMFYFRVRPQDGTGTWHRVYSTAFKPFGADMWKQVGNASTNTDMDTLRTVGTYYSSSTNNLFTNLPSAIGKAFTLHVESISPGASGTAYVQQTVKDYRNGRMWTRCETSYSTVSWTDWVEFYSEGHKPTPAEIGALSAAGGTLSGVLAVKTDANAHLSYQMVDFASGSIAAALGVGYSNFAVHYASSDITDTSAGWAWRTLVNGAGSANAMTLNHAGVLIPQGHVSVKNASSSTEQEVLRLGNAGCIARNGLGTAKLRIGGDDVFRMYNGANTGATSFLLANPAAQTFLAFGMVSDGGRILLKHTTSGHAGASISALDGGVNGTNLVISSGGNVVIGSGESTGANAVAAGDTSENVHIGADNVLYFYCNAQTWTSRKTMYFSSGNLYTPGNLYLGGDTARGLGKVTGQYGSIQTTGATSSWAGYSIGARHVFMGHTSENRCGLYNDIDNEWLVQCYGNGQVILYHNGANKLETQSTGAKVTGTLSATVDVTLTSDARTKDIEKKFEGGLAMVNEWTPTEYRRKGDGTRQIGLIAQDVRASDERLAPMNGDGMFSLSQSGIIATLVSAVQELTKRLEVAEEMLHGAA